MRQKRKRRKAYAREKCKITFIDLPVTKGVFFGLREGYFFIFRFYLIRQCDIMTLIFWLNTEKDCMGAFSDIDSASGREYGDRDQTGNI